MKTTYHIIPYTIWDTEELAAGVAQLMAHHTTKD
jgi:hypothetical protein